MTRDCHTQTSPQYKTCIVTQVALLDVGPNWQGTMSVPLLPQHPRIKVCTGFQLPQTTTPVVASPLRATKQRFPAELQQHSCMLSPSIRTQSHGRRHLHHLAPQPATDSSNWPSASQLTRSVLLFFISTEIIADCYRPAIKTRPSEKNVELDSFHTYRMQLPIFSSSTLCILWWISTGK